jgi:PHD/YefM family antitoxin component YafN of YafNO toxin-antitoxin module
MLPTRSGEFSALNLSLTTNREQRDKTRVSTPKTPKPVQIQKRNTQEAVLLSV